MPFRTLTQGLLTHPMILWSLQGGAGAAPLADPAAYVSDRPAAREAQAHLRGVRERLALSPEAVGKAFEILEAGLSSLVLRFPEAVLVPMEGFHYTPLKDCPLSPVVYEMLAWPDLTLEVIAHWHRLPEPGSAETWSRLRAQAIANHVLQDLEGHGGAEGRVAATGLGAAFPLVREGGARRRRQNRRIEFVLRPRPAP